MNKQKKYFANTYHHVYNRGVNKNRIFFDEKDYLFFLKKLNKYRTTYEIKVLSYCLMPNHFHLFLKQTRDELTIGKFISNLLNSHTKAINKKFNRTGVLYEGPAKSKLIEKEEYFKWLIKYIVLNPVRANLVKQPEDWSFSSANDLLKKRNGNLLSYDEVYSHFQDFEQFAGFIFDENDKFNYDYFKL